MLSTQITLLIDDEEKAAFFPDFYELNIEALVDYEPADPTVGIMHDSFSLWEISIEETAQEYREGDIPDALWEELEELAEEAILEDAEEARIYRALEQYENSKFI